MLWHAVDGEGRGVDPTVSCTWRYTRADQVAERIRRESEGEEIAYTVASPDMWQKRGAVLKANGGFEGESIAGAFFTLGGAADPRGQFPHCGLAAGAQLPCGRPGRRAAAEDILLLREPDTGTLPGLIFDEQRHGEDAAQGEDHAPESLRYALMSRPAGIGGAQEEEQPCLRIPSARSRREKGASLAK